MTGCGMQQARWSEDVPRKRERAEAVRDRRRAARNRWHGFEGRKASQEVASHAHRLERWWRGDTHVHERRPRSLADTSVSTGWELVETRQASAEGDVSGEERSPRADEAKGRPRRSIRYMQSHPEEDHGGRGEDQTSRYLRKAHQLADAEAHRTRETFMRDARAPRSTGKPNVA